MNTEQTAGLLGLLREKERTIRDMEDRLAALKSLLAEETAQKASIARALQYEQQKTEELINVVPWIVVWVSSNLKYKEVNSFFASLNGGRREQFEDKEVGTCGEVANIAAVVKRFVRDVGARTFTGEVSVRVNGQTQFFLLLMHRSRLRADVSIVGIEITEQKRAEVELRRQTERAKTAASELRVALDVNQKMRERAEAASRAKGDFLAVMSHELRTPMNGVLGMLSLLCDTDLTPSQKEMLAAARTSGDALLTTIDAILDFSKIEAGKIELETVAFDIRTLMEDVGDILALAAETKQLELICAYDPESPYRFLGDPGRLKQVLLNLATNAVKFTQQGEVCIEVRVASGNDGRSTLYFAVSDTGIGIPVERLGALFDAFTQGDSSTTRRFGGTGLGLTISKRLVELMGGTVGARSAEGRGSVFWFEVPLPRAAESDTEPSERYEPLPKQQHVLVAEPNQAQRRHLVGLIEAWGCRCAEVDNGMRVLEALQSAEGQGDTFDTVLISGHLPGIDPRVLATTIRRRRSLRKTRLVLMARFGDRSDDSRLIEAGFAAVLTKPIKARALYRSLIDDGTDRGQHPAAAERVKRPANAPAPLRGVRVLLAEDNMVSQMVASMHLTNMGCSVDTVVNGRETLDRLSATDYDLVLMDCRMPEMDGYEAARLIRNPTSAVRNHRIPIVALTASATQDDRDKCIRAGMDCHLAKPLVPDLLLRVIEGLLRKSQTGS